MKRFLALLALALLSLSPLSCRSQRQAGHITKDFITKNEDYYITRIGGIPQVDAATYRLKVHGLVAQPKEFTLDELRAQPLGDLPLTVECIGNTRNGRLISTAVWRGFPLYDFLKAQGLSEEATGVVYRAADGYYASHTIEQIRDNHVFCALYMNGVVIPPIQGFPLRVLNPGYYGVKQPAWVTEIEVIDRPVKDYWEDRGWDCEPPIAIDSLIFTPEEDMTVKAGETVTVTGAAFGGRRVAKVEVTTDKGKTWAPATITKKLDADHVWVFWEAPIRFDRTGTYTVNARATDTDGNVQPDNDPDRYDGENDWPLVHVRVTSS